MLKNIEKYLANVRDSVLILYGQKDEKQGWYAAAQMTSGFQEFRSSTEGSGAAFYRALYDLDMTLHHTITGQGYPDFDKANQTSFDALAQKVIANDENMHSVRAQCAHLGNVDKADYYSCVLSGGNADAMVNRSLRQAFVDALTKAKPTKYNRIGHR